MAGHQVEDDFQSSFMGLVDQFHQIVVGPETGIHLIEIDDVVAAVRPGGFKQRIEPDGRHAQAPDVIEFRDDAGMSPIPLPSESL